jgi:hypothetical protein
MAILILGGEDDQHAVHVLESLRRRGADAELLDSRWFPGQLAIRYDPISGVGRLRLPGGRLLDFAAIRSVYWRSFNAVIGPNLPDPEQAYLAGNDARSLFESLLIRLPARWVNGWQGYRLHQTKPAQLARVAQLGIPVPATLCANDADAVLDFARRHPRCIFKPVQGGAHARPLTAAHLTTANLQSLTLAPVTLQEEIPGTSVRVFVAGDRVAACEIRTASLDYRDDASAQLVACEVPDDVAAWCRAAARALDLVWTGIDVRRTPDGRHVFLEANPSPMFLGFQAATGLPLTEMLIELLSP